MKTNQQQRPKVLGIVNITRDSFSDGNLYFETKAALTHIERLLAQGADIIDIGAASSHPQSAAITTKTEVHRLKRILTALADKKKISLSIDSANPQTQEYLLTQKDNTIDYLNDINGFAHPYLYPILTKHHARLIVMFRRTSNTQSLQDSPKSCFAQMLDFFEKRCQQLLNAGIAQERIILDPGMGLFLSPNANISLYFLQNLHKIKQHLKYPILISVSRKSFLGKISGLEIEKRSFPTVLAEIMASTEQSVDYIRTHEPQQFLLGWQFWIALHETVKIS